MKTYTIKERYINGIETAGYIVEDNEGSTKTLRTSDVLKLALQNSITNAQAILDTSTNNYELLITNNEDILNKRNMITTHKYTLEYRLVNKNNNLIGYVIKDRNGTKYKVDLAKAWKLASENCLDNIEASIINGQKVLKSVDKENSILKHLKELQELEKLEKMDQKKAQEDEM